MDEKALSELLECSVCLEHLDTTARVLPCQHTFCKRCLEQIETSQPELRCPECRVKINIPVSQLPTNILLVRILEGMKLVYHPSLQPPPQLQQQPQLQGSGKERVHLSKVFQTEAPHVRALYNYEARESGDLSFKKGETIYLKRQVDENWFEGELGTATGLFPVQYVQMLVPIAPPQCRAIYDFNIQDDHDKYYLNFKKDIVISVIRRIDENWAEGKYGEKIGLFPISFVEFNAAAKKLLVSNASPKQQSVIPTGSMSPSSVPSKPPSSSSPMTVSSSSGSGHSGVSQPSPAHLNKRHSFSSSVNTTPSTVVNNRHSVEINPTFVAPPPPSGPVDGLSSSASSDSSPSPPTYGRSALLYVALYNYTPQKVDEIELRKGERYSVKDKCQDGWYKGKCQRTGKYGVFPGNYVQLFKSNHSVESDSVTSDVSNVRATNAVVPARPVLQTQTQTQTQMSLPVRLGNGHVVGVSSGGGGTVNPAFSGDSEMPRVRRPVPAPPRPLPAGQAAGSSGSTEVASEKRSEKSDKKVSLMKRLSSSIVLGSKGKVEDKEKKLVRSSSVTCEGSSQVDKQRSISVEPNAVKAKIVGKYRCIAPYPPQSEYELELKVGDVVNVYKKRDDGWYKGLLQRTGKMGLFPSSFVEAL